MIAFIAAVLNLDVTAVGRVMVSRPIICAPLLGFILGDVRSGLLAGIIIELLWIRAIPMGAAIPYDTTVLAVMTVFWGMKAVPGSQGALVLAMALAIPVMVLHKRLEISLRYLNIRISHWVEKGVREGSEIRIGQGVFLGLAAYFLMSFVFYLAVLYPGQLLVTLIYNQLGQGMIKTLETAALLLPVAGIGILIVGYHSKFPCPK